jgi:hypothetical protein
MAVGGTSLVRKCGMNPQTIHKFNSKPMWFNWWNWFWGTLVSDKSNMFVQVPRYLCISLRPWAHAGSQPLARPSADSVLKRKSNANFDTNVDHDGKSAEVCLKHLVHAFLLQSWFLTESTFVCHRCFFTTACAGMWHCLKMLGTCQKFMVEYFSPWQWWGIHAFQTTMWSSITRLRCNGALGRVGILARCHAVPGWDPCGG